ncbi:MAG: hypothetical protein ACM3WU_04600 [Bacillota bacterium]
MSEAMRQTLTIAGISMATIFGVMTLLYGAIKLMVRERNHKPGGAAPGTSA